MTRFIYEERMIVLHGKNPATLIERIPVQGLPPADFRKFVAPVGLAVNTPMGPVPRQKKVEFDADSIDDAFDMLPAIVDLAGKEIVAEVKREFKEATKPKILTPEAANGRLRA